MREIILDTETTGLDPNNGHRIIEIGCVELINHIPTKNHFHVYINPERDVPLEATEISGLTTEFLTPHPIFVHIADEFLNFIKDDQLIIHNASFDIKFLNSELSRLNKPLLRWHRVKDTLSMARQKFPGSPASLDALCKRFQIDLSKRQKHGALIDSFLLAEVYLELLGGRQRKLGIEENSKLSSENIKDQASVINFPRRHFNLKPEESSAHKLFLKEIRNNLWYYE